MSTAGGQSSRGPCLDFFGIINEAKERRTRRRDAPQPWIVRKLAIGFVVGIVGYAYYVYVVTFCIPMIQRHRNALGNKRIGIAFLVTFNILFLMFVWAYAKTIFTSPGYALEHTHQTPPPVPRSPGPFRAGNNGSTADSEGDGESHHLTLTTESGSGGALGNDGGNTNMIEAGRTLRPSLQQYPQQPETIAPSFDVTDDDHQTFPADALPPIATGRTAREERERGRNPRDVEEGLPPPFYSRRPPTHPVLSPEFRYCPRDGIVKPMRTHHCRACGTCVLKYDHHCPWIGQCVGAYNQKFFVNFLQWSTVFTIFVFISVLVMYARLGTLNPEPAVNPQHFVILGLSFLFALFPLALLVTQFWLIALNMTTVEHLHLQRMQQKEKVVLSELTGSGLRCFSSARSSRQYRADIVDFKRPRWPWQAILLRKEIRRRWDEEWGKLGTEGNLWWLGTKRANWEAVMGKSKWGWFLPLGHSSGDGLSYPRNPRFGSDGRWRRRLEWPDGLR